jgi:hypothetical protein
VSPQYKREQGSQRHSRPWASHKGEESLQEGEFYPPCCRPVKKVRKGESVDLPPKAGKAQERKSSVENSSSPIEEWRQKAPVKSQEEGDKRGSVPSGQRKSPRGGEEDEEKGS